ncbi:MAG: alpha-L-rhamnosidase, partial [bacterium]|nr:alpha-L-rhamnosidase [bacterium]
AMTGPVRVRTLRVLFAAHPSARRGAFACSDALLNRIWEVGRHTLLCCSEDTFTDCPTYEQTLWVGDARNESLINYAAHGDLPLTRRCAELTAESLFRSPLPESQVPSAWDAILTAWSYMWIMMVEEHWRWTGDLEYLRAIYPAVRTTLRNTVEQFYDERGLMAIDTWNMFDWAGIDDCHKVVTHNEMFIVDGFARAAYLAEVLGEAEDRAWFEQQRAALIDNINTHLWNEERGAYVDALLEDGSQSPKVSQQVQSLAILYGIAPPERLARIAGCAAAPPEGMTRVGSPFALFFILEALVSQGRHDEVMRIVRKEWGEMIRHGATTFWETFPGYEKDWWTRSYCHAWSSAPVYFLSRYQLGAWWAEPGYAKALVAPVPLDLVWAQGRVPTPRGEIGVFWRFEGEGGGRAFLMDVALPAPTAATVILPVNPAEYPAVEAGGFAAEQKDGRWTIELPAGTAVNIAARRGV